MVLLTQFNGDWVGGKWVDMTELRPDGCRAVEHDN